MQVKIKKERGSITLFVLIAVIFFLSIAFTAYASSINKIQNQDLETSKIKTNYENSYTDEQIYEIYTEATKSEILKYAEEAMPEGAYIDKSTNEETGIVMIDSNQNEWVWIEVPEVVFESAKNSTDYDAIEEDLIKYAKDYREGKLGQGYYWTDEWYDYLGTTYDGESEYSQVKYIISSSNFNTAKTYYGTIYKDNGGTEIADSYQSGITYYVKSTDIINDTSGCGLTYEDYNAIYEEMLSSIYTNKGFYIARYEAGIEGSNIDISKARTSHTEITYKAVSKKDMLPYNLVYCSEAQILANDMATGGKTTSLLFGIQWDLVCKFLEVNGNWNTTEHQASYYINQNSTSWGNYNESTFTINSTNAKKYNDTSKTWESVSGNKTGNVLLTTGASEHTKKMNIYDFAGNEWAWTLEHADIPSDGPSSGRGGIFSNSASRYPASSRYMHTATYTKYFVSFRSSLY